MLAVLQSTHNCSHMAEGLHHCGNHWDLMGGAYELGGVCRIDWMSILERIIAVSRVRQTKALVRSGGPAQIERWKHSGVKTALSHSLPPPRRLVVV